MRSWTSTWHQLVTHVIHISMVPRDSKARGHGQGIRRVQFHLSQVDMPLCFSLSHLSITCLFFVVVPATTAILAMRLGAALGCLPPRPAETESCYMCLPASGALPWTAKCQLQAVTFIPIRYYLDGIRSQDIQVCWNLCPFFFHV